MASFVSSNDLSAARDETRHARQKLIDEEKKKYQRKEEARLKHKESGNDRWLLPGIESRVDADASKIKSSIKKHKKHKKKKKRKKSSSDDTDSDEEGWEEKPAAMKSVPDQTKNWMNFDDLLNGEQTYTSASIKKKKEEEKMAASDQCDSIGQHPKELNPYWKNGGEGLPSEQIKKSDKPKTNTIHKEWLLKSLKRMNEQAEEQDRSIESIAAERYGSWQEFQRLLREADPHNKKERYHERTRHQDHRNKHGTSSFMLPRDDDDDYRSRSSSNKERERKNVFMRPGEEDDSRHGRDKQRNDSDHRSSRKREKSHRPSWKKAKPKDDSPVKDTSSRNNSENDNDGSKNSVGKLKSAETYESAIREPLIKNVPEPTKMDCENKDLSKQENIQLPSIAAPPKATILTEKEKNHLAARILKAELIGNEKLANTLKSKLERAREAEAAAKLPKPTRKTIEKQSSSSESSDEETVVLTRTGKDGQSWPLQHSDMAYDSVPSKRRKKSKVPTHKEGDRERYFADDDGHSLQDLVRREKTQEAEDQDAMFSRLASKQFHGTDSEYFTLDDMYVSEASRKTTRTQEEANQRQKAISDHRKLSRRLEKCRLCFGNPELPKHLLIAIGKNTYLSLPDHKPLSQGHCIIVPMHHCTTGTGVDEDVWDEVRQFMRALQTMFKSQDMDCVFMQTCIGLKKSRHFFIDCIPMPIEEGEMAPIYFKKAIQESESEWSHNKKLIDTRGKNLRNCVPKGFPYFSVDFGVDGGFAHVVEDEALFPFYFGREIVGGMLDVEPRLWRNPPKDHFTEQTKRSLQFSEWWKPHDWTSNISSTS